MRELLDAGLSIEDVINPWERRLVEGAYEDYHRQREDAPLPARTVRELGRRLLRSPDPVHQLEAGCALMQSVISDVLEGESVSVATLNLTHRAWLAAEEFASEPQIKLQAHFRRAYLKSCREFIRSDPVDLAKLTQRLTGVNAMVVGQDRARPSSANGIASELALATLLNRHALKTSGKNLAWPSMPWQDRQHGGNSFTKTNFDISRGPFPVICQKIQVKSWLDQDRAAELSDPLARQAYWRAQYPGIALIFGDIHLGNTREAPTAINQLLIKTPSPATEQRLDDITQAILQELAAA